MNTRTYPRTTRDAFPRTVEYASFIEGPQEMPTRWFVTVGLVALVLWTLFAILFTGV